MLAKATKGYQAVQWPESTFGRAIEGFSVVAKGFYGHALVTSPLKFIISGGAVAPDAMPFTRAGDR